MAGTDVTLLDETATPLGAADVTNWEKIWDTTALVIFEAVGVKPDDFVALRVDGTFSVKAVNPPKPKQGKSKKKKENEYTIYVWDLDLDGDSDQTGLPERTDKEEEIEEAYPGVICLPNWDDDDKDKLPDCCVPNGSLDDTDTKINGTADKADFRRLIIQRIPKMPPGTRVVLRFRKATDARKVRVFNEKDVFILGPESKTKAKTEYVVPNIEASSEKANETLTYLVEGIIPREELMLELVAQSKGAGSSTAWKDIGGAKDSVFVMVAPFLLAPNERPALQAVLVPTAGFAKLGMLPRVPPKSKFKNGNMEAFYKKYVKDVRHGPEVTYFWQDPLQFGYASVPGPKGEPRILPMVAKLRYPKNSTAGLPKKQKEFIEAAEKAMAKYPYRDSNSGSNKKALLAPDRGVFEPVDFNRKSNTTYYGGNIEVTWPEPKAAIKPPYGRLCMGDNKLYAPYFKKKQKVQLPIAEPRIDWLDVKHIDEVVMFLKGKDVTMPSSKKAKKLLKDWLKKHPGKKDQPLFYEGKVLGKGKVTATGVKRKFVPVLDIKGKKHKVDAFIVKSNVPVPNDAKTNFVHFYSGKAKYQTYQVVHVTKNMFAIIHAAKDATLQHTAKLGQLWREKKPADPAKGDEFYFVEAPLCVLPYRVIPVAGTTAPLLNPITLSIGELLDTKSPGSGRVQDFWALNDGVATRLAAVEKVIDGLGVSKKIKLPVLFWNKEFDPVVFDVTAFTPNLNNGSLFGKTFGAPEPFVLPLAGGEGGIKDLFCEAARADLKTAGYTLDPVHDWYVSHLKGGEVHCSAEVLRKPDPKLKPPWWEETKK